MRFSHAIEGQLEMQVENEASLLKQRVEAAAKASDCHIVLGLPDHVGGNSHPEILISAMEADNLIRSLRPRILYIFEQVADQEGLSDEAREDLGFGEDEELPSEVVGLIRRLSARSGEVCRYIVTFLLDGVFHTSPAMAQWLVDHGEAVQSVSDEIAERRDREREATDRAEAAELEKLAHQLSRHEGMTTGRPSQSKRTALARALFTGKSEIELMEIVRHADELLYLEQVGARPAT